ncbi:MAG: hypothetical protein FJW40_04800 [Acidobacteria bacterium]|nr:hypothetical protein [Acidobacteriota bacterium]
MSIGVAALLLLTQQPTAADMPQEMVWVDRTGKVLGRVGARQQAIYFPEVSPDGTKIAVSARDGAAADRDIWIHDTAAGTKEVLEVSPGNDNFPVWRPDGREIIFTSSRLGNYEIYRKPVAPAGEAVLIHKQPESQFPRSWSPTGRWLLFTNATGAGRETLLWRIGEDEPIPLFAHMRGWTEAARFSPDGLYIAYVSNVEGPFEVYVSPTREPRRRWKVSRTLGAGWAGGGWQPRWSRDGTELFYVLGESALMRVKVQTGDEFRVEPAERLFALTATKGNFPDEAPWLPKYDVAPDGQRFVFVRKAQ